MRIYVARTHAHVGYPTEMLDRGIADLPVLDEMDPLSAAEGRRLRPVRTLGQRARARDWGTRVRACSTLPTIGGVSGDCRRRIRRGLRELPSLHDTPSSSSRAGCPSPATHPVRALRCEPAACRRHPARASRWRRACVPTPGAGIIGQGGSRVAWGGWTQSVEKAV